VPVAPPAARQPDPPAAPAGPRATAPAGLPRGLAAFRHRDYRLFWFAQLVSLTGTWLQSLAQSWLVLTLTNSPVQLGLINVFQFGPSLLLGLPGGVLADRVPKRRLLMVTQTAQFAIAAALAALVALGRVELWHIYAAALLAGVVNAVDMPTRQAFVTDMVGRDDLMNAIALNSALFNTTRILGPALAGALISTVGIAVCFVLNAASFLPVVAALALVRAEGLPGPGARAARPVAHLKEGLGYVAGTPAVLLPILLVGCVATFGMNFNVWVPLLARDDLGAGAVGFGLLMAALGVGSLTGALALAFAGRQPHRRAMLTTAAIFGGMELALALAAGLRAPIVPVMLLMAGIGFAMSTTMAMANTTVQSNAPDALRGRVMSVYTTVFTGSTPLGAAVAGGAAAAFGAPAAVALGGAAALTAAAGVALWGRAHPVAPVAAGVLPAARGR
jgi:MFS family permease